MEEKEKFFTLLNELLVIIFNAHTKIGRKVKMENLEVKFLIENTGKWSEVAIDSVDYVIKFDIKDGPDALQSISCWLSDFSTIWLETIPIEDIVERLKKCNPLLACNELMSRIISTITTVPKNGNHIRLTGLNDDEVLHFNTKYFLSDGSDQIPLKFYWSLEKGDSQLFYENFSKIMLLKIIDLEKTNVFLLETIRKKDEELHKQQKMNKILNNRDKATSTGVTDDNKENEGNGESASTDSSADSARVCHEGITCNHCKKDVFGHRYNCLECDDFDLCMACEHKEMQHSDHIMVRYAKPEDKDRSERVFRVLSKQTQPKNNKRKRQSHL